MTGLPYPVMAPDQPVYATAKQLHWRYPGYIIGPEHTEMAFDHCQ